MFQNTFLMDHNPTCSRGNGTRLWKERLLAALLLPTLLLVMAGCQFTQSAFVKTVDNVGGAFSAASLTLSDVHAGKLPRPYAQSSFSNYQSELDGIDQQLPSQQGVPNKEVIEHLLAVYRQAMPAVDHPCLDDTCDWHAQVTALDQASKAFLKAGEQ